MLDRRSFLSAGVGVASAAFAGRADATEAPDPWELLKRDGLYLPQLHLMQAKAAADVKAWGQQLSFWEAMVGNEAGAFAAMASNALAWRGDRPAPVAKIDPAGPPPKLPPGDLPEVRREVGHRGGPGPQPATAGTPRPRSCPGTTTAGV